MKNHFCIIDADGIYKDVASVILAEKEDEEDHIEGYVLQPGETLVDAEVPDVRSHTGDSGFVRPRREGSAWVENATAEEIAAWEAEHPAPEAPPPSQLDSVEAQSTYTAMMTETLLEG